MSRYSPRMDLKEREKRRMEAVKRLRAGESARVVAADLGVASNTVYEWSKRARLGGKKALATKGGRGRPLKLEREHWAKLKKMVLKGPKVCGFERELWTLPMIREFIQSEFGVDYHEDHLSKFMRRLGFSAQKPMVRARERDEKAIKRFVQVEFPAIEKKRGGGVPR